MPWILYPFLRYLLFLIAGILVSFWADFFVFQIYTSFLLLFSATVLVVIMFAGKARYYPTFFSVLLLFSIFVLGIYISQNRIELYGSLHFSKILDQENQDSILFQVSSQPKWKEKTVQFKADQICIRQNHEWRNRKGQIWVSLALSETSLQVKKGYTLVGLGRIKKIEPVNPFGLDLRTYYMSQNVYHRIFLPEDKFRVIDKTVSREWIDFDLWRQYIVSIFKKYMQESPREFAVVSALVIGERKDIDNDTNMAYARAGVTHILSVSGLHVGLISTVLGMIFLRGRNKRRIAPYLIVITLIWFYALISGGSASVLRSALMFSMFIVMQLMGRDKNMLNVIFSSAFLLLIFDPLLLCDIGFQLSYLALLGIVLYYEKISSLFSFNNYLFNEAWKITAVGIAAQLLTAPLCLYYFHQFPMLFWLSGLIVIPVSTIILYAGVLLILVHPLSWLSGLISKCIIALCYAMNAVVFAIDSLPFSVWEGLYPGLISTLCFYGCIGCFMHFILRFNRNSLKISLLFLIMIQVIASWKEIELNNQEFMIVPKTKDNLSLVFVQGRNGYLLRHSAPSNIFEEKYITDLSSRFSFGFHQKKLNLYQSELRSPDFSVSKNGFVFFREHSIVIPRDFLWKKNLILQNPIRVDYLVMYNVKGKVDLEKVEQMFRFHKIIIAGGNSKYSVQMLKNQASQVGCPLYDSNDGGIMVSFKLN